MAPENDQIDQADGHRNVGWYVLLAFGLSWLIAAAYYLSGGVWADASRSTLVGVVIMWCPAVAALLVGWRLSDTPVKEQLGLRLPTRKRWILFSCMLPLLLIAVAVAIGASFPGMSLMFDIEQALLEHGLPAEEVEAQMAQFDDLPVHPLVVLLLMALVAGLTVNAVVALGEELGWRGYMLNELRHLGFWKASLAIGVVWGIWHAPLILQGHNFPQHPVIGVGMMTLATTAITPVYLYITIRSGSVLSAAIFHGTFNALGNVTMVLLALGTSLLVSPVGVAGVIAAAVLSTACVVHDRRFADDPITTGQPLPGWSGDR